MSCDCVHERDGMCARFPKVSVVVLGKTVWTFPPADAECGERAARTGAKAKTERVPANEGNPASDGAKTPSKPKKAKAKAD